MLLITNMFFPVHSQIQFEPYFIKPRAKPSDSNTILNVMSTHRSHQCVIACIEDPQCNVSYWEANRTCSLFAADCESRNGVLLDTAEGDTYIKGGLCVWLLMLTLCIFLNENL